MTHALPALLLADTTTAPAAHGAGGGLHYFIQFIYLVAAGLFVFSLHWMNDPKTARRSVLAGVAAMALAVVGTLLTPGFTGWGWFWILVMTGLGFVVGVPLAMVPLTAVPQRTALSHAFGGLAAGLVGMAKYYLWLGEAGAPNLTTFRMTAIAAEVLLGFLTFTGSLMAAAKLQGIKWKFIQDRPLTFPHQNILNFAVLGLTVLICILLINSPASGWSGWVFPLVILLALTFGVLLIIPIGGADMPTVIAILNSYAALSAVAMGFVLDNKLLITAGALDGSSGLILAIIMCKAMNRSFTNVMFGAFGQVQQAAAAGGEQKTVRSATPIDVAQILETANRVVIVPGYGMAVSQAQRMVRELYDQLVKRGIDVKFAIHPVAGRMPGHMNVLLAEVEIPYDKLIEMEEINPELPETDVALILGANDVVNPAARHDKTSPIYGMPIIDADKAKTVIANKRSMNPGFAGIENELYYMDQTLMLFGDTKKVLTEVAGELKNR